jgi:site-specific recombinase XerD
MGASCLKMRGPTIRASMSASVLLGHAKLDTTVLYTRVATKTIGESAVLNRSGVACYAISGA